MIQGVTITLLVKTPAGVDGFNNPVYAESQEAVDNVLVGQPSTDEITNTLSLYGKRVAYTLGIPKDDTHDWVDVRVILPEPFAGTYRTIGYPVAGIPANMPPLAWNKKVLVERYG